MKRKKLGIYLALVIGTTAVIPGNITVNADTITGTAAGYDQETEIPGGTSDIIPNQEITPAILPAISPAAAPDSTLTSIPSDPTVTLTPEPEDTYATLTPSPEDSSATVTPIPADPWGTLTPVPEDPSITLTPAPEVSPEVSVTPDITPSPVPTKVPYRSQTLEKMAAYDYVGRSVTGITQAKEALAILQKNVESYGTLFGTGMPYKEFKEAMSYEWTDATEYDKKPVKITVDMNQTITYKNYVNLLKQLSRYPGVYLYKIGKTTQGRDLYAIEIDVASTYEKNVIMLTGQVHAREFGAGTILTRQLVELVQKAQTDKAAMDILKKNKYVAVPIINVDGREQLIYYPGKWIVNGNKWKAYYDGTDGGRNFPGLQWGQVIKGGRLLSIIAGKPGYANYPGPYAGSSNETKAMMKWLYQYVIVEKASLYIDMHNQGSVIYAGKPWQTKAQEKKSLDFRTEVMNVLNKGITKRKYTRIYENSLYGLRGEGTSLTDYAVSLAVGAKFSPAYGFSTFSDGKQEYTLMQIRDLDTAKVKVQAANPDFAAITLEIGYGAKYLGNTAETKRLFANEYVYYNYGRLLEALPKMIRK